MRGIRNLLKVALVVLLASQSMAAENNSVTRRQPGAAGTTTQPLPIPKPAPAGAQSLQAAPGYVFVPGPGPNQAMMKSVGTGGGTITLGCECVKGTGNCYSKIDQSPGVTVYSCGRAEQNPCTGGCRIDRSVTTEAGTAK